MQPTKRLHSFTGSFRFTLIRLVLALGLVISLSVTSTGAATRTWTGGHASSANWNLRDNWGGIGVPANGDTLVFPSGAARLVNTNNIAGLRLNAIQFTGAVGNYNLRGLGLTVTNGITLIEGSSISVSLESLTLGASQAFHIPSGGSLVVNSDIALNGFNLSLAAIGDVSPRGVISGNGNLNKSGAGLLSFIGPDDNTFNGSLTVTSGTLAMNKKQAISLAPITFEGRIAVPGNLILSNGSGTVIANVLFEHQIANTATVTINEEATLHLNGNNATLGDIVLKGGAIHTGVGTLTLGGNVTSLSSADNAVINGLLYLGDDCTFSVADGAASIDLDVRANIGGFLASLIKTGAGTMRLGGTNTYFGMTFVNGGQLNAGNDSALGTANGTTEVNAGAQLLLEHGVDTLEENLTLSGAGIGGTNAALRVAGSAAIEFNVILNAPATIDVPFGSGLTIEGVVSGTGPLTKIGLGTLQLAGSSANTFTGELRAENGLLLLSKLVGTAAQGDLVIGTANSTAAARHTRSANLGGAVTVNASSLYDLDGVNESIDSLTLNGGGDVRTGTGKLTLDGDVVVNAGLGLGGTTSSIDGELGVGNGVRHFIVAETGGLISDRDDLIINAVISGSASIVKQGGGDLSLTAANTFTGQLTVQDGELRIAHDQALGSTGANTVLTGDAMIDLSGDITVDENLFLNTTGKTNVGAILNHGTNDWTGSIFLGQTTVVNVPTNSVLNISGVINGLAGLTKSGAGTLIYSGTASNTYIGVTLVNEGTLRLARTGEDNISIPGALVVGDGLGGPEADVVETVMAAPQIDNHSAVTVNASGVLRLNHLEEIGSLSGSGRVILGGEGFITGRNDESTAFGGTISGPGPLVKQGEGTFTLNGTNTYTGDTVIYWGTLVVNGQQPNSDVLVGLPATLAGSGRVGNVEVHGTLRPGNPRDRLDVSSVDFQPNSTLAVQLQHTPDEIGFSPSHNWFRSFGAVDVTGASLDVSLNFAPVAGQTFTLADKTAAGAVTGTFSGMPQGAVIVRNDIPLRLSYTGGNGNDVVLAVGDLPLRVASTRIEAGNGNGRIDPDECDNLIVAIENTSALPLNGVTARLEALDPRIAVTQAESLYGDIPGLVSRTNRTAFQIRIASGYPCGSAVDLHLVIQSANHGPFALPVRLLAGSPGAFQTVDSTDVPRVIPDLGVAQSTINWPNNFRVGQVRVKLHATHPAAGHTRFWLRNPDGDEVLLSANHGGNDDNYGINCARLTVFDDDALTKIADGSAPFDGTFAPEASLSPFVNRSSSGIWTLIMEDTVAGGVGTLQCWSLELARAVCTDGGGGCESCATRLTGSFSETSRTMPERLTGTFAASGCGNVNHCPGTVSESGPYRYDTHSFTNNGPDTCVTVLAFVPCGAHSNALYFSAHLGDLNPGNLCGNYLGDVGQGIHSYYGEGSAFSFRVPAGEGFTVVVAERNHMEACGSYSLELFGLPCPQERPMLHIANDAGPDSVRLHWSTAYPGFDLQRKSSLGGGGGLSVFTNMNTAPLVIDGHYSVTNKHDMEGNGFFRLRKP
jgi:autotransporter-associated beta strand protein